MTRTAKLPEIINREGTRRKKEFLKELEAKAALYVDHLATTEELA